MTETDPDSHFLRTTFDLARLARESGHRPFGAVVVEADEILARAMSTQGEIGGSTNHAEMNAVRIAQSRASRKQLERSTIYSSSEPCAMCTAAIFYSGIGRIVFGFPERQLRPLRNQVKENAGIAIGCREVLAKSGNKVSVVGPLLEKEAEAPHHGYWTPSERHVAIPEGAKPRAAGLRDLSDETFLRHAIGLAKKAGDVGEMPFGAVIVGGGGQILVEAKSTELSEKDWTCHAETNAVRIAGTGVDQQALRDATIFASSEPCAMCASAIFYSGLRRIVFGYSEPNLRVLLGSGETAGLGFSCREILSYAAEPMDVRGPLLEKEAEEPHLGYWSRPGGKSPDS